MHWTQPAEHTMRSERTFVWCKNCFACKWLCDDDASAARLLLFSSSWCAVCCRRCRRRRNGCRSSCLFRPVTVGICVQHTHNSMPHTMRSACVSLHCCYRLCISRALYHIYVCTMRVLCLFFFSFGFFMYTCECFFFDTANASVFRLYMEKSKQMFNIALCMSHFALLPVSPHSVVAPVPHGIDVLRVCVFACLE